VQRWYLHLEASPVAAECLSPDEAAFLRAFREARARHFGDVLRALPAGMQTIDGGAGGGGGGGSSGGGGGGGGGAGAAADGSPEATLRDGPTLTRFVVARAARDLAAAEWLDGDESAAAGSLYITSYHRVRRDVAAGNVELT